MHNGPWGRRSGSLGLVGGRERIGLRACHIPAQSLPGACQGLARFTVALVPVPIAFPSPAWVAAAPRQETQNPLGLRFVVWFGLWAGTGRIWKRQSDSLYCVLGFTTLCGTFDVDVISVVLKSYVHRLYTAWMVV